MMNKELISWPHKLKAGLDIAQNFYHSNQAILPKNVKKIVFVGMGGSGVAGRIMKTFLDRRPDITTTIIDSPFIPESIDSQTLAIVMSYSGQTWETLGALETLTQKFIPTIVIAHGGQAAQTAQAKGIPSILLPESLTPRSALGNFLGILGGLFDCMGILPSGTEFVHEWVQQAEKYIPAFSQSQTFQDFLDIAQGHDFFHIWGLTGDSASCAYRAATQFNENAKTQAVYSEFPELAHNLLVGFEQFKTSPLVVFFYSDFLPAHMSIALGTIESILAEKRVLLYKPPIFGDTFQSQLFTMILWADFASYHLGHARGVDIERVQIIEELKKRQKTNGIK